MVHGAILVLTLGVESEFLSYALFTDEKNLKVKIMGHFKKGTPGVELGIAVVPQCFLWSEGEFIKKI